MFDKIKKIFGIEDKGSQETREVEINFNEVLDFVKQETKDVQIDAKNKIDGLLNEIFSGFEEIEKELAELKKAEPEVQMPISRKFDFKIRDRFCDNTILSIKKLKRPPMYCESIFNFLNDCDVVFKNFNDLSPKSSWFLMNLFKERMREIGIVVKNIQNHIKELREFLNSNAETLKVELRIEKIKKDIEKNEKDISDNEQKLEKNKKELAILVEKIDTKKKEIIQLENSREFFELNNLKNEIENKKREASQIEQQISSVFSGSHRIMKKFRHIDSGIDKEFTKHLDSYLNSPADAYINEKVDDKLNIHKILSNINKAIEKKEIDVSKREYSKWTELIDVLEKGDLIKHKQDYIEMQNAIKEYEQRYEIKNKPFKNKKEEIEKEIEKLINNLSLLKNQKDEVENNRNKFNSEFENNKNILNEVLENTLASAVGKVKVRIKY